MKQNRFSSKEIEDQLLLAIAGIEPSSLEPALNPALQSWRLNLAPPDLAELRVTRGQRGASSIVEKNFFFNQRPE